MSLDIATKLECKAREFFEFCCEFLDMKIHIFEHIFFMDKVKKIFFSFITAVDKQKKFFVKKILTNRNGLIILNSWQIN